ncbi:glutaminase A [Kribbella sp. VKM Ac-2568]|uniref:glutaminase A n=1 Tax=Kribbella sp. VKM Ac-2568 TaxID=2512219 RepID=UPI00104F770D|nr:glutaminase A [Kribbella sp. VKM Ac-2568]TCM46708.1 L-glutaminase [Kribbella sp. VKM Ac-2568]
MTTDPAAKAPYVSTGNLPPADRVQLIVNDAYERFRADADGELSRVYPSLAAVDPDKFGICVANTRGLTAIAGDADVEFSIMSVAKPFVFALMCAMHGPDTVARFVGVNATGKKFNSVSAIEDRPDGRTNPMVNPGAIATASMAPGNDLEEKWRFLQEGLSRFAGRALSLDEEIFASASATNSVNRAIGDLLRGYGRLATDSEATVDLYTRQSCLRVSARDLAVMAATLAAGGVNPLTGEKVVDQVSCRCALVVMATSGLYETSGEWLYTIGLPGKSGIGGGIVMVSPGKGGLGTFAPRLDAAGNSVKGQLAAAFLSRQLGLDLFVSEPD